jgi:phosphatidylglycerophosphatase A
LNKFTIFLATGGYSGFSPLIPGTVGTFVAAIIYYFFYLFFPLNLYFQIIFLPAFIFLAIFISHKAEKILKINDAPPIVIDEFAGFFTSMFLILPTFRNILIAFLLFRFFDIIKPFPVNFVEKKFAGGWGIVMDDILAGIYTNILLQVIIYLL